jgi:catalase
MASKSQATDKDHGNVPSGIAQGTAAPFLPVADAITGAGGELHQVASEGQLRMTTNHGMPLSDDHNSLKAGPRGPVLLEDFILREKIFHFDHERIPERVVHARGLAAHGYFELTDSLSDLTTALVLGEVGERIRVCDRHR